MFRLLLPAVLCILATCQDVVLNNGTLYDGHGGPAQVNMYILIKDGIIQRLSPVPIDAPGATVVDATGRFIVPGLIDSHVHASALEDPSVDAMAVLQWAYTTGGLMHVRDMAGDSVFLRELAVVANKNVQESPRLHFCTLVGGPAFFSDDRVWQSTRDQIPGDSWWLRSITTLTDIKTAVTEATSNGVAGIKIYGDLTASLMAKVATEAHAQGLQVWSHATVFPAKPSDALDAGVDVLSHTAYLAFETQADVGMDYRVRKDFNYSTIQPDHPVIEALLQRMAKEKTILDATLFVFTTDTNLEPAAEWSFQVTKRANELGIPIDAGTDDMGFPDASISHLPTSPHSEHAAFSGHGRSSVNDAYPNLHKELELLVSKSGLTPLEALTSATKVGAQALGIYDSYGTLESGKSGDILVLDKDPAQDVGNLRSIKYLVKGGVLTMLPKKKP